MLAFQTQQQQQQQDMQAKTEFIEIDSLFQLSHYSDSIRF